MEPGSARSGELRARPRRAACWLTLAFAFAAVGSACDLDRRCDARFFRDADGDGFGDDAASIRACTVPSGYASVGGDCDDDAPSVHPGADELCSGTDENCDGLLDVGSVDRRAFAFDFDGDGFGDPSTEVLACVLPGIGYTLALGDCDDDDVLVNPGRLEVPYDGVDQDCDPATPDDDLDGDGFPSLLDCNDMDAAVTPDTVVPGFTDVTTASGLFGAHWNQGAVPGSCFEVLASAAAAADVDGDADVDLFITRIGARDQLYLNDGDGVFAEVAVSRGIDHAGTSNAAVFFDADGDGDRDLFVASSGPEVTRYYENDGAGAFTESASAVGLALPPPVPMACANHLAVTAADLDHDGDLDLVLGTYRGSTDLGAPSHVFLNAGDGTFVDATEAAPWRFGRPAMFAPAFGDADGDGDRDVFFTGDWGTSGLWLFSATPLAWTDATSLAGVGTDENGMGSDLADFDGDGDLDWFVTSIFQLGGGGSGCSTLPTGCSGNRLFANEGGRFVDVTDAHGVRDGGWGWGAAFFDVDLDGDLDLAHENGFAFGAFATDRPRLFLRGSETRMHDVACLVGWSVADGRGLLPFDMDADGDLDVLRTSVDGPPILLRNDLPAGRAYLTVRLEDGTGANREGIGAELVLEPVLGEPVRRDIHLNAQGSTIRPAVAHFGLGAHVGALARLTVRWPDGTTTVFSDLPPNQTLVVSR